MGPSVDLFFAYSHRDEAHRDALETHLTNLRRQGLIRTWHDRRIQAGQDWSGTIHEHLGQAGIVLLLVSADFIASDYCYHTEMKQALEQRKMGRTQVVPVILRACDWNHPPLGALQALPRDALPVTSWSNADEAWLNVAEGIRKIILQSASVEPPPVAGDPDAGAGKPLGQEGADRPLPDEAEAMVDGASIARALMRDMPKTLAHGNTTDGALVFTDPGGLQLLKVREYKKHCVVRQRCSRSWGLQRCQHRKTQRNATEWLASRRIEDRGDLEELLTDFVDEWGKSFE